MHRIFRYHAIGGINLTVGGIIIAFFIDYVLLINGL